MCIRGTPRCRGRTDPCIPMPMEVSQKMISLQPRQAGVLPCSSDRATAASFHSLCLEPMSEFMAASSDDESDAGGSDTVSTISWAASSDG